MKLRICFASFRGSYFLFTKASVANILIIIFILQEDKICLSQLQNGATGALQEIVGTFYKPKKLMKVSFMQEISQIVSESFVWAYGG